MLATYSVEDASISIVSEERAEMRTLEGDGSRSRSAESELENDGLQTIAGDRRAGTS